MSVRISKSIMGIRFSTNLLSDTSPKERRPTQAELAAEDKEQFLEKISRTCNTCFISFLEECGYTKQTIFYAFNNGIELFDFVADEENLTIFSSLFNLKKELETLLNKIKFSNVLTAKRREEMTDVVFKIYDLINTAKRIYSDESVLKIIAERKNKPYDVVLKEKNKTKLYTTPKLSLGKKIFYFFAFLISGIFCLAGTTAYIKNIDSPNNENGTGLFFVIFMSLPLIAAILSYRKAKRG